MSRSVTMSKIQYILLMTVMAIVVKAQTYTVTPSVINSAGGSGTITVGGSTYEIYYNIGETSVTTLSGNSNIVTQGFLQPNSTINSSFTVTPLVSHETCLDKKDGSIKLEVQFSAAIDSILYTWSPSSVCPDNKCSTLENIPPGEYQLHLSAFSSGSVIASYLDTIVVDSSQAICSIKIYNGFTPNGDGINDAFYIYNIENFSNNHVEIYNRWGQKLADIKNYDNTTNNWKGTTGNGSQTAPAGTYFYIIDLNDGGKPIKGWLELTTTK